MSIWNVFHKKSETVEAPTEVVEKAVTPTDIVELGVGGAKISNGFVYDDFLQQLNGERGRKTYREMRDNDSTVGAVIFAIETILRNVTWTIEENLKTKGSQESIESADFLKSVIGDMEHSWDDFITDVLSFLTFGWEYTEVVYKLRKGPNERNKNFKSEFSDGKIGIRKLGIRGQETIERWKLDSNGEVEGMFQNPPEGGGVRYIPKSKALLFRPHTHKGSPEGRSVLRNAYRPWFFLKGMQEVEAIAVERELNGLPVVKIPNAILNGTSAEAIAATQKYIKMVRDIKFNEQGGVVLPSDPYYDADGKPTNIPQVELTLLASTGTRAIQTNEVILRYQREIARTVMADFLMLGSNDRGSFAMSKDKSSLFIKSAQGWLNAISDTVNKSLVSSLWARNGFDLDVKPIIKPGNIAPIDLEELGKYISDLARSGAPLFPDPELEDHLRSSADLPNRPEDLEDTPVMPVAITDKTPVEPKEGSDE
jgi:hypothetical protein